MAMNIPNPIAAASPPLASFNAAASKAVAPEVDLPVENAAEVPLLGELLVEVAVIPGVDSVVP